MNHCDLCDVDIPGGEDASEQHNTGKRHIRLVSHREKMSALEESSIFVKWKHASVDVKDLQMFNQFGKINRILFRGERAFAIIEFETKESAQKALEAGELVINTVVMEIEKRKLDFSALKVPDAHVNVDEVINKLQSSGNILEEAAILIDTLVIPEDEANRRQKLCESLQKHFADYFCNCCITLFGSSVTLIGFLDSDLDAHLHISEAKPVVGIDERNKFTLMTCDPAVFKGRKITYSEMKRLHSADQVRLICRIVSDIRKTVGWISYPNAVLDARCPVVRLQIEKQWLLDLSMNNFIGAEKTSVLDRLVRFDGSGCLRRLLVIFRFWAMSNGLCRAPFNQHVGHFNAYTLNWLLVYFLMKINVVPKLQLTTETIINSSWKKVKPVGQYTLENYEDIALLKKFFVFIVETKLSELILSPIDGKIDISKEDFRRVYLVQEEYKNFKLSTCLNIQDPIELSHNLGQNVTEEYMNGMKNCMKNSLKDIFSISSRPTSSKSFHTENGEHMIKIPNSDSAKNISHSKIFVEKFLNEIMRWDLHNFNEPNMKRMKLDQDISENSDNFCLGQYVVPFAVWIGRRYIKRELLKSGYFNEWELESKISESITRGNKNQNHNEAAFIAVTIKYHDGDAYASFKLIIGAKVVFDNAVHFIDQMFTKWASLNFSF